MKKGHADLPLHYGIVPQWLAQRMCLLGGAIVEAIVMDYGRSALMQRLSDPLSLRYKNISDVNPLLLL